MNDESIEECRGSPHPAVLERSFYSDKSTPSIENPNETYNKIDYFCHKSQMSFKDSAYIEFTI